MSFNLRDELMRLSSTTPLLKDKEDAYSDDDTKAKVDSKSTDYANELDFFGGDHDANRRRFRASIGDLSEYGKRYKGTSVSRKKFKQMDSEDEDDDVDNLDEDEVNEEEDEDEDDDLGDEDDEEDEDEVESDSKPKPKAISNSTKSEESFNLMNYDRKEEIEKGKAVKNQLNFWDSLLESRIKLQNALNTVNQFPQHSYFEELMQKFSDDYKQDLQPLKEENQTCILKAINQLIELQQRLVFNDPETSYLIKELGFEAVTAKSDEHSTKQDNKRKRAAEDDNDYEEEEGEDNEKEEGEEGDDEEIYSDTDEEMKADEIKKSKKQANFEFEPLQGGEQLDQYLSKFNKSFHKYKEATIQKWYDKTRLITGKSFQSLEKPILQQIEHILMDKDRILKRTQLKRSLFKICGKVEVISSESLDEIRDRHLKDYDEEIFDDQDFYNQLLRELIERKTNSVSDPVELSRRAIELQKLRSQNKKNVDTKASKGRKIRFEVHKPMVNFMAPIYRTTMPEEARSELFKSLFGSHITMPTTNGKTNGNKETDLDFSNLFKGF